MTEASEVGLAHKVDVRDAAFARLVERELAPAYRTASLLLGSQTEAEDATQEALIRAWQRLDRLRDASRAGAWFGRILVNVCRDRLRQRSRAEVRWSQPVEHEPEGDLAERDALMRAVAGLSPDQRIVIVLRYYLDLPLEAIAERTGAPVGTVKSRLHYALQAVRAAYEAQERTPESTR